MKIRKPRIICVGHGGIDLEAILSGILAQNNTIDLTPYLVAEAENGDYYLGKIYEGVKNGKVKLTLDGNKKNFSFFQSFKSRVELDLYLANKKIDRQQITELKAELSVGQGALNSAYDMTVFNRSFNKLEIYLATDFDDSRIRKKLPKELRKRYRGSAEKGKVITNLTISGFNEKLTFRAPSQQYNPYKNNRNKVLEDMAGNDGVFINGVKNEGYTAMVCRRIRKQKVKHVYISPTDSMVSSLNLGVKNLLEESEVYVAQISEMEKLLSLLKGEEVKISRGNSGKLKEAMLEVRSMMKNKKKNARVYVTDNVEGSYVLDENDRLYYHKVIPAKVENTSGCGDAFASVVVYLEHLRNLGKRNYLTEDILKYASVAGQIKAGEKYPYSNKITVNEINKFLNKNPEADYVKNFTPRYERTRRIC